MFDLKKKVHTFPFRFLKKLNTQSMSIKIFNIIVKRSEVTARNSKELPAYCGFLEEINGCIKGNSIGQRIRGKCLLRDTL